MNHPVRKAVAAAIALGAVGTASAFPINSFTGTPLLISGSTAVNAALLDYFLQNVVAAENPCDVTQPIDEYTSSVSGKAFTAVACIANSSLGTSSNQIVIIQEQNSGSFNAFSVFDNAAGTLPSASGNKLVYPVLSSLSSSFCTVGSPHGGGATDFAPYNVYTCTTGFSTTSLAPNLGFSDVEASLFSVTVPSGAGSAPSIILDFNPIVSVGLYHALQAVEGLTQDDTLANMPTLPLSVVSGLFTGQITSFSSLTNTANTANVGGESVVFGHNGNYNGGVATTPALANVFLCRRDDHSGTEKTAEIVFGNLNCSAPSVTGMLTVSTSNSFINQLDGNPITAATYRESTGGAWVEGTSANGYDDGYAGALVFAGSSTGNVLSCVAGHDQAGLFAIGMASLDNAWGSSQSTAARQDWRPIKVNGVVPSIENVAAGLTPFWAQSTLYTPPTSNTNYPSGDPLLVLNWITSGTTAIGTAAAIQAVDDQDEWGIGSNAAQGPAFDGGILGIPGNAGNVANGPSKTQVQFRTNPVSSYVKATGGVNNNCQPAEPVSVSVAASGGATWQGP